MPAPTCYLATDQVRFYRTTRRANYAHAGGGGYAAAGERQAATEPLALEVVPPLVFTEVMRDVDLFVGVASVGNDPELARRRPRRPLPRLLAELLLRRPLRRPQRPASRCSSAWSRASRSPTAAASTTGSSIVRGDMRTYKIHLGSGNILMEPNDQYLCIVPTRAQTTGNLGNRLFLPFEGDRNISIILSKAFLLAEDKEIKDPTILHQISP